MRPVKLEFKGINSFSEHTIVDFDALTRSGLFGIFGDTGSGKSTIPDAINFALYGDVERSKEKTDIINNRCSVADVKFVFDILSDGKRKTYTVERQLKRDKYGTHKAALYENGLCIADKASQVEKKVTEIVGVDAADFRKCIALPQGEFAQFVKSAPAARLALIERLFNLSRYGDKLKAKLSERQSEAELKFQNLSGRLQAYEGVSRQTLDETSATLKEGEKQLEKERKNQSNAEENYRAVKALCDKAEELASAKKRLAEMDLKRAATEELRAGLSVLSDCREAVKTDCEIAEKRKQISDFSEDAKRLEKQIGADISSNFALQARLKEENFDERISSLTVANALCLSCENKVAELDALNGELEKRRADFKKCEREISALGNEEKRLSGELSKLETRLSELSGSDLENLINVEFKGAFLKREYASSLEYFSSLRSGLKVYEEDSPLYRYASTETESKIAEYKGRLADLQGVGDGGVEARLKRLKAVEEEREKLRGEADGCREKLGKTQAALNVKKSELESAARDGKSLRARADALIAELERAFGRECTDYSAHISRNAFELKRLKDEKQSLTEKIDVLKSQINGYTVSLERLKTLIDASNAEEKRLSDKLITIINSKGLENIDKCRAVALKFESVTDAEKTVKDFDAEYAAVISKIKELESVKGLDGVTAENLADAKTELNEINERVERLTGEIAVAKSRCKELESKLKERAALDAEYAKSVKERNLISALKEVIKGNKFFEYIANEYLADISALASSTLLKLTGGRYFLSYKENNFFAGDNFDCGNLRGVNTLSGGETFLVSLSLALALSQTICSRSLKSIEFFFLDEGFGTLDASLVDTVMDALDKLKSSSFTIGVISHVEELKNRIPNKITVNKATETRGSTVNVSC